jgi:uncharacterized protein
MTNPPQPLANVFTLGAHYLKRLRQFYASLGWKIGFEADDYVAFELGGSVLALFPADKLAADGRARAEKSRSGIRFTIAILAMAPEDVDTIAEQFRSGGGRVTKPPTDAEYFVGRSAYVADPEDNYWEIVWAPDDNPVVAAAKRAVMARG